MSDLLTIDIAVARKALQSPETMDAFLALLGQLSPESVRNLAPLVFDVVELENQSLGTRALERIIKTRQEWINLKNRESNTPLMEAVMLDRLDMVEMLLAAGAKSDHTNKKGLGALDMVACQGSLPRHSIGDVLLENRSFTAAQKDLALYSAAGNANLGMVRSLLSHGAGFSETRRTGTALTAACRHFESNYPSEEIVRAMLQTPGGRSVLDSGWCNPDYGTYSAPIHGAAYADNLGVLSTLVEAGACINAPSHLQDSRPETALMAAACGLSQASITFLLQRGADAKAVDHRGAGVLHHLARSVLVIDTPGEDVCCLGLLLHAGADPFLKDDAGKSPLDIARGNRRRELSDVLAAMMAARVSSEGLEKTTIAPGTEVAPPGPRF